MPASNLVDAGLPTSIEVWHHAWRTALRVNHDRMARLYEVVSRIVEQGHGVNITRLHDYCGGEEGLSAESVDGGPIDEEA